MEISKPDCLVSCDSDEDCAKKLGRPCPPHFSSEIINEVADLVHKNGLKFGVRSEACKYYFQNYQVTSHIKIVPG